MSLGVSGGSSSHRIPLFGVGGPPPHHSGLQKWKKNTHVSIYIKYLNRLYLKAINAYKYEKYEKPYLPNRWKIEYAALKYCSETSRDTIGVFGSVMTMRGRTCIEWGEKQTKNEFRPIDTTMPVRASWFPHFKIRWWNGRIMNTWTRICENNIGNCRNHKKS